MPPPRSTLLPWGPQALSRLECAFFPRGLLQVHRRAESMLRFSLATVTARPPGRLTTPGGRAGWIGAAAVVWPAKRTGCPSKWAQTLGSLVRSLESQPRPAAEARAQGVAARGATIHRGASGARGLGALTYEPRRLRPSREGVGRSTAAQPSPRHARSLARQLRTHLPRASGTRSGARANTGSPQPHARWAGGGRARFLHARARGGSPRPQPLAFITTQLPASAAGASITAAGFA